MSDRRLAPPSPIGAQRFGLKSATKAILGITEAERAVLVAVLTCELAEQGYPTAAAIQQVAKNGSYSLPSRLAGEGLLVCAGYTSDRRAVYRISDRGRRVLGVADEGAVAAE